MYGRPTVLRSLFGMLCAAALASCARAVPTTPAATVAATLAAPTTAAAAGPQPTAALSRPSLPFQINADVSPQADGTSLVRDISNTYEFTLGQGWMAIPVSEEWVNKAGKASPAPDPEFLMLAQKLAAQGVDAFRLVGINTDSKFTKPGKPTLVLVTAIPDPVSAALPMPDLAHMIQDTVFTDSTDVRRDVVQNANGLKIAVVEGSYDYYSTQGETLKMRSKVLGFQANARVVLIQFIVPVEFAGDVLPGTGPVLDSINRLTP